MLVLAIHALSPNKAALLAREMPNLGRLLIGKSPIGLDKGRKLVKRTLRMVQGNPKLIELANANAIDPGRLRGLLWIMPIILRCPRYQKPRRPMLRASWPMH